MPHIILIACHLYFDLRVWYNVHNTFFVGYSSQAFHGFDYTNNPEQMFNLLFITANETSWKLNSSLQKWHGFQWNECIKYILAVGIKRNAPIVQFCIVLREQLIYNIKPWTKVLIINYDNYIKGFETKVTQFKQQMILISSTGKTPESSTILNSMTIYWQNDIECGPNSNIPTWSNCCTHTPLQDFLNDNQVSTWCVLFLSSARPTSEHSMQNVWAADVDENQKYHLRCSRDYRITNEAPIHNRSLYSSLNEIASSPVLLIIIIIISNSLRFIDTHKFICKLNVIARQYYLRVNNMHVISRGFILLGSSQRFNALLPLECFFSTHLLAVFSNDWTVFANVFVKEIRIADINELICALQVHNVSGYFSD